MQIIFPWTCYGAFIYCDTFVTARTSIVANTSRRDRQYLTIGENINVNNDHRFHNSNRNRFVCACVTLFNVSFKLHYIRTRCLATINIIICIAQYIKSTFNGMFIAVYVSKRNTHTFDDRHIA